MPQLTCSRCKRRKIRCDKRNPCSTCQDAGEVCEPVQRARLPRGRTANPKKTKLQRRLAQLDDLLTKARDSNNEPQAYSKAERTKSSSNTTNRRIGEFVAPEFWASLTEEIADLRETLEESDAEENSPSDTNDDGHTLLAGSVLMFGPGSSQVNRLDLTVSDGEHDLILSLYRTRVDSLYKILHWPTAIHDLENLRSQPARLSNLKSVRALQCSMYFMALRAITDAEAVEFGFGDRSDSSQRYRENAEQALSEANLLQCQNITLLQAFVIYLLALRTCNNSAASWTLLAIAIRIGTAMRLGQESDMAFSPLDLEIRRRLWYSIALIDTFASLDRGTPAMIRWEDLGPAPLLINDDDISSTNVPLASATAFNDMSFFGLTIRAMICNKRILSLPGNAEGWAAKLELVTSFGETLQSEYINVQDDAPSLQRFAARAATGLVDAMQLILRRPPYKQYSTFVPASDNFDVLDCATRILQHELEIKSPEFAIWAWKNWVQWYTLAIVLAELCNMPLGERYESSYAIAAEVFGLYGNLVADNDTGRLWKPIARLMRRVEIQRNQRLSKSSPTPLSTNEAEVLLEEATNEEMMIDLNAPAFDASIPWTSDLAVLHYPKATTSGGLMHNQDHEQAHGEDDPYDWSMFMNDVNLQYASDMLAGTGPDLFWNTFGVQQE